MKQEGNNIMTETHTPEAVETPQDAPEGTQDAPDTPDTFPRAYVEQLRQEAAEARVKAKRADDLAEQLFVARVAATGRLADPSDLPFDADALDDLPAMEAAIDALIAAKPHLAARTPRGDIGQGITTQTTDVDLAALLRRGA